MDIEQKLWERLDQNDRDHRDILSALSQMQIDAAGRQASCGRRFVGWKVFILLCTLVVGCYGFAYGYGNFIMKNLLEHISKAAGG